jgi:acetyltransferase-like isoleucine patch superfamily enzyme
MSRSFRLSTSRCDSSRIVPAVHGARSIAEDPAGEVEFADLLRERHSREELLALYSRFAANDSTFDTSMRRIVLRALSRVFGNGITIAPQAGFRHPGTFEIGDGVFIDSQVYIQGRFDGRCVVGKKVWLGPQVYLDARGLVIGDHVGMGPGSKVLGSQHTDRPFDIPIIESDLEIKPVVIEDWPDVGTNAVILPGVTIGRGAIVGAGAMVTRDVPPFAVAAGVPAKAVNWRDPQAASSEHERNGAQRYGNN